MLSLVEAAKELKESVKIVEGQAEIAKTRNEPFTKEQILLIQHRHLVGACWPKLGNRLEIDQGILDRLTQDNNLLDSERAHQVLNTWIKDKGNDATVGRLACALIDIGKEQIAERLLAFNQGEKSKQLCEREEGRSDRPSDREKPENMLSLVAELVAELVAVVKELREIVEIVSEQERQQKESAKLQKQMIEELEQMKLQLQHVPNTNERKKETSRQDKQSKQPTERKNREDALTLRADVRELRTVATESETSVQQKENEELKEMIQHCRQMDIQVQQLIKRNETSRQDEQSKQPTERKNREDALILRADVRELRTVATESETRRSVQQKENEELKEMIQHCGQMDIQVQQLIKRNETSRQDEQSKQPTERKNREDALTLRADVRKLRRIATERETRQSVQQKENEELKEMITKAL